MNRWRKGFGREIARRLKGTDIRIVYRKLQVNPLYALEDYTYDDGAFVNGKDLGARGNGYMHTAIRALTIVVTTTLKHWPAAIVHV